MRLVFLGASRFGLRCLDLMRGLPCVEIVGVVTTPKTFPISYRPTGVTNVLHADIATYASVHGFPAITMERSMGDHGLLETVASWRPKIFLVSGWYHLIPPSWRKIAPAYGLHASLLPDYSGGAPLVWAMINGETRTGITLFELADGVDNGPILGQSSTEIRDGDSIATLYERIEELGLGLIREHLPKLAAGTAKFKQQVGARRRIFPQRRPEDGKIDWAWPAMRIHNFIRAQTSPYPGAFSTIAGESISIWQSAQIYYSGTTLKPGRLLLHNSRLLVGCGNGEVLELLKLGPKGVDEKAQNWMQAIKEGKYNQFDTV